jgi:hypothetical protein
MVRPVCFDQRGSPADGNDYLFLYILYMKIDVWVDGVEYRVYEFQKGKFRRSCKNKHKCPCGVQDRIGLGAQIGDGPSYCEILAKRGIWREQQRFQTGYDLVASGLPGGVRLLAEPDEQGNHVVPEMVVSPRLPSTRWSATLSSKVNLHHEINFGAVSNDKMAPNLPPILGGAKPA